MASRASRLLSGFRELLQPVLADRLQHQEAGGALRAVDLAEQALLDEECDPAERVDLRVTRQ